MRVYGLDFTSSPSAASSRSKVAKRLTLATCSLKEACLLVEELSPLNGSKKDDYSKVVAWLDSQGEWIAAIDFPFGQPARLIADLGWPTTWDGYVRKIAGYSKRDYAKLIDDYRARQSADQKEHFRAVDRDAGSLSPMKMYFVPTGKMFHQGAPLLLASPCRIVPFTTEDKPSVIVEAYPGLVARKFIQRRSYKHDDPKRQTSELKDARKALVAALTSTTGTVNSKRTEDWYGFRVEFVEGLADECIDDPTGDKLDAVLAAIQAAWAYSRRLNNYGVPNACNLLEGWIPDPEIYIAAPAGELPAPEFQVTTKIPTLFEELGDVLASLPSEKQLLSFRPSEQVQERYRELLHRSSQGGLTRDEQYEFNQFEQLEMLLQYVKSRIRAGKKK